MGWTREGFFIPVKEVARCRESQKGLAPFPAVLSWRTEGTATRIKSKLMLITINMNEIPKQENAMTGDGDVSETDISQNIRFVRSAKSTEGLHQPKRCIILFLCPEAEPMQTTTLWACANNATHRSLPAKESDGQDGRGIKISGGIVLCNGRGDTREKSQFQTG